MSRVARGYTPRMRFFSLIAVVLMCACRPAEPPKNLILITVDTLRADRLSSYGYDRETSPHLDRWAEGGMVFERAWSASSWTLPSMNMLLTGQVRLNNSGRLQEDQTPIAERLADAGYRTGAVIANGLLRPKLRYDRGFQSFEKVRPKDGVKVVWDARDVMDRGLAWLEQDDGRPFFLFLHFLDPHHPYTPKDGLKFPVRDDPERLATMSALVSPEDRERLDGPMAKRIETQQAMYDSEILYTDRILDELFERLEREGLAEDTLVVFTSDHGEGLWQRPPAAGEDPKNGGFFPALYQTHGAQLFSEQVHVPLVLRGPGVPVGRTDRDVSLLDVAPTIYRLIGVAAPARLSGRDLFDRPTARPLFSICSRGVTVTVDGRWRLHRPTPVRAAKLGLVSELYDLGQDPGETSPLDDPQRAAELEALIDDWTARYEHTRVVAEPADAEHLKDLRDLGYAGEAERLEAQQRRDGEDAD